MISEEILSKISQGENEIQEFKSSFGKEVIETIVAFANTNGGNLFGCWSSCCIKFRYYCYTLATGCLARKTNCRYIHPMRRTEIC